ncbi:MAG: ATPase domain-containing protein [Thermoplasmatota archaeon]
MNDEQPRIRTGIDTLDDILGGGFPAASINIIAGGPGTGKTMLVQQIAYGLATPERKVLYLTTVSEPLHKVLRYVQTLPFFDADKAVTSIRYEDIGGMLGKGSVQEVMGLITDLVRREAPAVLVIDSFKALSDLAPDPQTFRRALYQFVGELTASASTSFLIGEYAPDDVQHLPEFAVADAIIELTNERRGIRTYRYLSVAKLRGSGFLDGRHAMRLTSQGVQLFPRFRTPKHPVKYEASDERLSMGSAGLDEVLGGGFISGSTTLAMGPTGTGKTILGLGFVIAAATRGETAVFASFQEDETQLRAITSSLGWQVQPLIDAGRLTLLCVSPVEIDVDEHIIKIVETMAASKATCIVIDSVSDLEANAYDEERFVDYMYSLVQYCKDRRLSLFLTMENNETAQLSGWTESGVSRIADIVLYLSNQRDGTRIARELRVLKSRGSAHDHDVQRVEIGAGGLRILRAGNTRADPVPP